MSYNPSKSIYFNPNIEYLFGDEIIEYDIRDAGYNIIKQYKLLPDEKIRELSMMQKGNMRHIAIGKLQRDDKILSRNLLEKFTEVRSVFIHTNNLSDNDIISVKKDAIYTVGKCNRLNFGNIEFSAKNKYTSYIRFEEINNLEIYYSSNNIDIKGMSDSAVNKHRLFMLEFLRSIIKMIENNNPRVKRYIIKFINDYKFNNLEDEFYLEFNNFSREINPLFNYKNIIIPLINIIMKEINQ